MSYINTFIWHLEPPGHTHTHTHTHTFTHRPVYNKNLTLAAPKVYCVTWDVGSKTAFYELPGARAGRDSDL